MRRRGECQVSTNGETQRFHEAGRGVTVTCAALSLAHLHRTSTSSKNLCLQSNYIISIVFCVQLKHLVLHFKTLFAR